MWIQFQLDGVSHSLEIAPGLLLTELLHTLQALPADGLIELDGRPVRCDLMLAAQVHQRQLSTSPQQEQTRQPESLAGGRA